LDTIEGIFVSVGGRSSLGPMGWLSLFAPIFVFLGAFFFFFCLFPWFVSRLRLTGINELAKLRLSSVARFRTGLRTPFTRAADLTEVEES